MEYANPKKSKVRGLSLLKIKVIAAILLLFGTLSTCFLQSSSGYDSADMSQLTYALLTEAISWISAPLYAWMTVNALYHASSRRRYVIDLFLLAIASEIPYNMATGGKYLYFDSQNPVWALAVGAAVLCILRMLPSEENRTRMPWNGSNMKTTYATANIIRVMLVFSAAVWIWVLRIGQRAGAVPIGLIIFALILIFSQKKRAENTVMLSAAAVGALAFVAPALGVMILHWENGEKGWKHSIVPKIFYVLYPAQLLIFGAISMMR